MISSHSARHSEQMAALAEVLSTVTSGMMATRSTWPRFLPQKLHRTPVCCPGTALIEPSLVSAA
jgi:hypothetical protein